MWSYSFYSSPSQEFVSGDHEVRNLPLIPIAISAAVSGLPNGEKGFDPNEELTDNNETAIIGPSPKPTEAANIMDEIVSAVSESNPVECVEETLVQEPMSITEDSTLEDDNLEPENLTGTKGDETETDKPPVSYEERLRELKCQTLYSSCIVAAEKKEEDVEASEFLHKITSKDMPENPLINATRKLYMLANTYDFDLKNITKITYKSGKLQSVTFGTDSTIHFVTEYGPQFRQERGLTMNIRIDLVNGEEELKDFELAIGNASEALLEYLYDSMKIREQISLNGFGPVEMHLDGMRLMAVQKGRDITRVQYNDNHSSGSGGIGGISMEQLMSMLGSGFGNSFGFEF